ncbi:hypothetical protein GALMADRAFT_148644 [Galerina marginata CBS 339.88]|uniref:F-box domain-containing protein n=1 Tax=Galerina marginata (strain CBS 339.88) TaxID=685588 RepID=A0A067SCP7_GALM3|nr:hypothetical protein GALMADRAFT_148644 [Galerina marginata CBS 339.88]
MTELKTMEFLVLSSSYRPLSQQTGQNHDNSSSTNLPPILNLDNDILWWIFWLNADMEDEAQNENGIIAIDTLRYSSQVCSGWRQVILSFSSLWGQVINLSRLEDHTAGLSEDVAAEILEHNWDRIRWLELDFTPFHWMDKLDIAQFWETLRRPSEVLETFRITFEGMDQELSPILSPADFVVFNNLAPALRVFFAPNIKFNLDAPWLANIRFLALNGWVSAYDVIQAIPHMPFLECLTDEKSNAIAFTGDALSSLPQITAPSINKLIISSSSDMGPYMDFLAQIKPAAGCYLAYSHTSTALYTETLTLANQVLYNYSRCCDFPSANHISLDLYPYLFNFEAQIPRKGYFRFKLRHHGKLPRDTHTL